MPKPDGMTGKGKAIHWLRNNQKRWFRISFICAELKINRNSMLSAIHEMQTNGWSIRKSGKMKGKNTLWINVGFGG